jgi:hypothetical protein
MIFLLCDLSSLDGYGSMLGILHDKVTLLQIIFSWLLLKDYPVHEQEDGRTT